MYSLLELIKELGKSKKDKEDLKTTCNNYFLQVQILINQKAIGASGVKNLGGKSGNQIKSKSFYIPDNNFCKLP
jgi:hypothetical protein